MKRLCHPVVLGVLRWILAGVFVYAGATKLASPANFSDSIASFALLPHSLIPWVALGLPPFEIVAGICVVTGVKRRAALLGLTGLTVIFLLALGSAVIRGIPVDCGCFGSGTPSVFSAWIAFGRDLLILAAAGMLFWNDTRLERADAPGFSSESC